MIKISLVDDDPEDRASLISLVQEIFQNKNITFSYAEFESAEDFLASYESGLYDLCFLDIFMKNMNGMDAAREIRKLDPELAIVFLTSSPDYVYEGYDIPVYYDPMIGKLIVWATTRAYAIERMRRVLYEYKITGLKTNLSYLKRSMHNPDFVKGEYNTLFIAKNARMLQRSNGNNEEIENIAMIAAYMDYLMNLEENTSTQLVDTRPISRWREFGLQKGVLRI